MSLQGFRNFFFVCLFVFCFFVFLFFCFFFVVAFFYCDFNNTTNAEVTSCPLDSAFSLPPIKKDTDCLSLIDGSENAFFSPWYWNFLVLNVHIAPTSYPEIIYGNDLYFYKRDLTVSNQHNLLRGGVWFRHRDGTYHSVFLWFRQLQGKYR